MKKTIQQKRLDFLNETVNHYNINNRCESKGECKYNPKSLGIEDKSEGCAIGRHLSKRLATKLDNMEYSSATSVFEYLPKKLQVLEVEFLQAVQSLHDQQSNWDEEGLSDRGKHVYNGIVEEHCTE